MQLDEITFKSFLGDCAEVHSGDEAMAAPDGGSSRSGEVMSACPGSRVYFLLLSLSLVILTITV